ncbi:hypothetical protein F5877DRAFT_49394 [Lentinula edodes]|nr:hypothetical protein F5877DRAFT_49394 [Lentinula edodes]
MFDISRILNPLHSRIALFLGHFHRESRSTIRNQSNIADEKLSRSTGKPQTRKILQRRRTRGTISTNIHNTTRSQHDNLAVRDGDYYSSASNDDTCCILRAEDTLFKVHKLVICRDGSAFERKLWFRRSGISLGASDANPLIIRSHPEKFKDLLWVLHAPPDFYLNPEDDFDESYTDCYVDFRSLSFYRLLNIAEMAHKYSFRSFECWAIHQIYLDSPSLLEEPLEISDETDELYSRLLLIALTCDHPSLLHYLVQKLVTKILWYNHVPGVFLVRMLEQHRRHPALATLLGVVYYRILIDMPQTSDNDGDYIPEPQPIFPPTINVERRMQFLAAHHRLTQAWRNISSSPPVLHSSSSPGRYHNSTESRSFIHYSGAALKGSSAKNTHVGSSADVLGLLKIMMLQLRKLTASTSSICMDCSLEGLEAVDLLRDQLIEGLINMFVYEQ